MTNTLNLGNRSVRPPGTRHALAVKSKLEHRVLRNSDVYETIRVGGGCAVIEPASVDAVDVHRIKESVDVDIYYIRPGGVYIH